MNNERDPEDLSQLLSEVFMFTTLKFLLEALHTFTIEEPYLAGEVPKKAISDVSEYVLARVSEIQELKASHRFTRPKKKFTQ